MSKESQNNKKIKESQIPSEAGEDATQYGEFITSYFAWVPPEKQKEKVKQLENITKKNSKNKRNN